PGTHVTTLVGGDYWHKRDEIDRFTYLKANRIIVNTRHQVEVDRQGYLYDLLSEGKLGWENIGELGELVAGKVSSRKDPESITLFKNNHGMGIQFATAAYLIYEQAKKKGIGRDLPREYFITEKKGGVWAP
ncbi:MAG: hypothetical protein M1609_05755, partial [Firmicutes bacterium]|nr:hypothetical protein [Bacillota bacterium]